MNLIAVLLWTWLMNPRRMPNLIVRMFFVQGVYKLKPNELKQIHMVKQQRILKPVDGLTLQHLCSRVQLVGTWLVIKQDGGTNG
nr:MAG TPA: hypothetical protein [Caudoviricetes sp.]